MAKQITISVHFCEECPRFDDSNIKCTDNGRVIDDVYDIPECCPLEDD